MEYSIFSNILFYLKPILEISIITYVFYKFYLAVQNTKAEQIIKLLFIALAIASIAYLLNLETIKWLIEKLFVAFILFLIIIYQQELRRIFTNLWSSRKVFFNSGTISLADQAEIVLNACEVLASQGRGALIVFSKNIPLKNVIDSGIKINANLSKALILTIFGHDTELHDGAMIISESKIQAAACYLPLSNQDTISKSFGTRHRAALGLSEESDAVIIVVSEEKRTISLCYNSTFSHDLTYKELKRNLLMLLSTNESQDEGDIKDEER